MCEPCNGGGNLDRRDFLKISGTSVALGGLWAAPILAQNIGTTTGKKKTKIAVLFMYPPANVVNEGRFEDNWASNQWFTYSLSDVEGTQTVHCIFPQQRCFDSVCLRRLYR
jgi:hypothetical protein